MPKYPGSGRKKGTPNKSSLPLKEKAEKLGIDPYEVLLLFASGDWKKLGYDAEKVIKYSKDCQNEEFTIQPAVRAKAAGEACKYLYPTLKSTEGTVKVLTPDRPLKYLTDEELDAL